MEAMVKIKAELIAGAYVRISEPLLADWRSRPPSEQMVELDNLYHFPSVFIRLTDSMRVRLLGRQDNAPFELEHSTTADLYNLTRSDGTTVLSNVELERAQLHAPDQAFFTLYDRCVLDCRFCPVSIPGRTEISYSPEQMVEQIHRIGIERLSSIGITSGIPFQLARGRVIRDTARAVELMRHAFGDNIPIGVSVLMPSRRSLLALKRAGATEIRLNLEVHNEELARRLTPHKRPGLILNAIEEAVGIFGRGKVTSNMILGIGETDEDVIAGVEHLARLGAIATLYPYDFVPERHEILLGLTAGTVQRPSAERLLSLAYKHKEILTKHCLDPRDLKTMCPACCASFLMPFVDF